MGLNVKLTHMGIYAKAVRAGFRLLRDPKNLDDVKSLSFQLKDAGALHEMIEFFQSAPGTRGAFVRKPSIGVVNLADLRRMPHGSLGQAYAAFLGEHGIDPEDLNISVGISDEDYMVKHFYETHDIWHVVTGFGVDVANELGLQAFYAAQGPAPLSVALLALGLLNAFLYEPDDVDARLSAITDGWRLGKEAKPLFGVDWAAYWQRPLADVRRELGIYGPLRRSA